MKVISVHVHQIEGACIERFADLGRMCFITKSVVVLVDRRWLVRCAEECSADSRRFGCNYNGFMASGSSRSIKLPQYLLGTPIGVIRNVSQSEGNT